MMHHSFPKVARRAANHADVLLSGREASAEFEAEFERFGRRLCEALRACVAEIADNADIRLVSLGTQTLRGAQLAEHCAPLIAPSRHRFGLAGHELFLALDGRAILEQLDRIFGGTGDIAEERPANLPHTALLLAKRFEEQALAAIARELGSLEFRREETAPSALRAPFLPDAELTALTLEITGASGREWRIVLALETTALPSLLPTRATAQRGSISRRKPGIAEAPFADLPLSAKARLVDMTMPLHRLADIRPGTVIPIMIARSVPLQIDETVLARGTVGEVDDRVALQITQILTRKETR